MIFIKTIHKSNTHISIIDKILFFTHEISSTEISLLCRFFFIPLFIYSVWMFFATSEWAVYFAVTCVSFELISPIQLLTFDTVKRKNHRKPKTLLRNNGQLALKKMLQNSHFKFWNIPDQSWLPQYCIKSEPSLIQICIAYVLHTIIRMLNF